MKALTKESKTFMNIWINLFIVFTLIGLMMPRNPIMTTSISILYSFGFSLLWATLTATFLYTLYLFIGLVARLFKKEDPLNN